MSEFVDFIFPQRLHRVAYFFRGITVEIITAYFCTYSRTNDFRYWWIPVIAFLVYELCFVILPRIRDVEMSGWWLLAVLLPIVGSVLGIILLFRRPVLLSHPKSTEADPLGYQQIAFPSGIS
ncbi:MAG TPA: DUF805 domain-containing protein [Verrucomicrobiae bacterium]|jgi:uncharacterized membrane protein YhaH (DUF805 family)